MPQLVMVGEGAVPGLEFRLGKGMQECTQASNGGIPTLSCWLTPFFGHLQRWHMGVLGALPSFICRVLLSERLWQVALFPAKSFWIFLLLCKLSWAPFIEESPAGMGLVGFPSPCLGIPGPTLSSELESCCATPSAPLGEWGGRKRVPESCTASTLKPSPVLRNPSCPVASSE